MSQETPDTKISIEMINEIHKTTDRALELWRHVAQFSYEHQFSLAKHYQWLNITFLTACAAIYAEFIKSNPNLSYLEIVCFAALLSLLSLLACLYVLYKFELFVTWSQEAMYAKLYKRKVISPESDLNCHIEMLCEYSALHKNLSTHCNVLL